VKNEKREIDMQKTIETLDDAAAQAKISDADERARLMLDSTPMACTMIDKNYNCIDCNKEALKLFGVATKQEYVKRFFDFWPERQPDGQKSAEKVPSLFQKAFEEGHAQFEWLHMVDGEPMPTEVTIVRVEYGGDHVLAGYTRDLRKLKEAQAKMREADERAQIMLEQTPLVVMLWDKDANILDCNQEAVRVTGLSSKKEYIERLFELTPDLPDGTKSSEAAKKAIAYCLETGYVRIPWALHHAVTGELIPFDVTTARVKYKGEDVVISYAQDVRERNAAIEKIREADDRARAMIEQAPLVVMLWDKDANILDCNQEAVRVTGLSSKQEYIDRFFEIAPDQLNGIPSKEAAKMLLGKTLETGFERVEWVLTHPKTGEAIPFESIIVHIKYKDEYILMSYGQDVRERNAAMAKMREAEEEAKKASAEAMRAYAEAEMASEAKSRFLANMSHEMRTPMNVIVGLTDLMLEEEDVSGKAKETLKKINTAGNTLMGLINDVLDISKIESGKQDLNPVQYELASFLNDIVTLNIIRIGEKPIVFKLDINEEIPHTLFGDDLRVKQILNNLLSNAFKYTKEGSVTLSVTAEKTTEPASSPIPHSPLPTPHLWVTFTISDTGIGIRKEDIAKLFSDYNQVDTKANREIEGTGLGLSITKKFVEMMGGEITVESEYGKGTTFRLRIQQGFVTDAPIGKETVENLRGFRYADKKKQAQGKLTRSDLSYARVLVVDDFPMNLDVAAGMLRKYKMQVDCAASGREAVDRITAGDPAYDAIFMDHMMPGMDGIEATKLIRASGTEYAAKLPIIALTANAVAGNEQMFLENGFNAFLPKPFNAMILDAVVQRWIRQKSKEQ
jgi:PAS domain S-box-containing protein